jgi:hypothetical protein
MTVDRQQTEIGRTLPPATVSAAAGVLARGLEPTAEDAELGALAAQLPAEEETSPATAGEVRAAALEAIAAEPRTARGLQAFEEWLEGETRGGAALQLACRWALPAAGLELERVRHEAGLYIDAYPFEGRIIGNLGERTARWLAQRTAMFVVPAERLPAVRRAIVTLAEAAQPQWPAAAASLRAAAAETDDETLWHGLSLDVAENEMRARRV